MAWHVRCMTTTTQRGASCSSQKGKTMPTNSLRARSSGFMNGERFTARWQDAGWTHPDLIGNTLSLLRVVVAFLFVAHGLQKVIAFPAPMPGPPMPLTSLVGIAGIIETVGGILLLVGLFTRPVAFILCGEMAVAYFTQHAPGGFWPLVNGGELAVLYCFLFLFFAVAGGGTWSLDALRYASQDSSPAEGDR